MHTHDPDNITRTLLDPKAPFITELDADGGWPLDRWKAMHATSIEFPVCDPWARENTVTRVLPNGKRIAQSLYRRYSLQPGEEVEIPRVHRRQVRSTACSHAACLGKQLVCDDREHAAFQTVVGGAGPFLGLVGEVNPVPVAPSILEHPSVPFSQRLVDAITQPQRHAMSPDDAALERARGRRAGGGA